MRRAMAILLILSGQGSVPGVFGEARPVPRLSAPLHLPQRQGQVVDRIVARVEGTFFLRVVLVRFHGRVHHARSAVE